jgi:hypothetical protein
MTREPRNEEHPPPALARELARLGREDFAPGFERRVLARLATRPPADWTATLATLFPRVAWAAVAAIVALALWNIGSGEGGTLERLLRLTPLTVEASIDHWAGL